MKLFLVNYFPLNLTISSENTCLVNRSEYDFLQYSIRLKTFPWVAYARRILCRNTFFESISFPRVLENNLISIYGIFAEVKRKLCRISSTTLDFGNMETCRHVIKLESQRLFKLITVRKLLWAGHCILVTESQCYLLFNKFAASRKASRIQSWRALCWAVAKVPLCFLIPLMYYLHRLILPCAQSVCISLHQF